MAQRTGSRHGTVSAYRNGCRCDACRAAKTAAMRRYIEEVRIRDGVTPRQKFRRARGATRPCAGCGAIISNYGTEIARCRRCTDRHRKRTRAWARAEARLAKQAVGTRGASEPWVQGTCARCGQPFTRKGQASSYCSGKCRRADRNSVVPHATRLAVYARDGGVCQLCFESVDLSLPARHPWSATLDHIECQSWTLIPDHSEQNLRLAHLWCNSVRGDERYYSAEHLTT